jgi:hypothetical protein
MEHHTPQSWKHYIPRYRSEQKQREERYVKHQETEGDIVQNGFIVHRVRKRRYKDGDNSSSHGHSVHIRVSFLQSERMSIETHTNHLVFGE